MTLQEWDKNGGPGVFVSEKYTVWKRQRILEVLMHSDGHLWWFKDVKEFTSHIGIKADALVGEVKEGTWPVSV